ncbi:MAG: type II secretion system protein [Verrucomicrobia bacterium]|nr:type II secretion system protein [Verrucomicrobiota bacterium]
MIELLMVIAIIGMLVSMMLPGMTQAKRRAREAHCINNVRQQGVAFKLYIDDYQSRFPPDTVREFDPSMQQMTNKFAQSTIGGGDPSPGTFSLHYAQAVHRPLYQYQGSPEIFRCPLDAGSPAYPQDTQALTPTADPSMWETIGCSYIYNSRLQTNMTLSPLSAPIDTNRVPPMIPVRLHTPAGWLTNNHEAFVIHPDRYILVTEPPARPLPRWMSGSMWIFHWSQWHRRRAYSVFTDPRIAPRMFVSPTLFVDGHVTVEDFSDSVMKDPFYPYEETANWVWYQPAD